MNILYLTPHLSTGGMPEFLRKRIDSIEKNKIDNIRIHVIEFNMYSDIYVVQRNKIIDFNINFTSLNQFNINDKYLFIKDYIINNNINIIHIDDNIESFDGMSIDIIKFIYNEERKWRIIETCHNNYFNKNLKIHYPDAYAFCSSYHLIENFSKSNIPYELIEYPIINKSNEIYNNPYSENTINILSVGLWTPGKNHKNTIELAKNYLEYKNIVFNFVGNMAENFKHYWGDIVIPENCKIWGEQENMDDFYKNCDLFLFNSINECNPIAIKEAMSYNKPILLRNLKEYNNKYTHNTYELSNNNINNINILDNIINIIDENQSRNITYEYDTDYMFYKKHIDLYERVLMNKIIPSVSYRITYNNGPKCEILGYDDENNDYTIKFSNNLTNEVIYETTIKSNCWASPSIKYFIEWKIEIFSTNKSFKSVNEILSLKDKNVCIRFDSSSLGDTLSWYPQVKRFRDKHRCNIILKTYKNFLFDDSDGISIIDINTTTVQDITYNIGCYNDKDKNKNSWNKIPLGQIASDILGLEYIECKPLLSKNLLNIVPKKLESKYIIIATNSTAKMKLWNNPNGWNELTKYLNDKGYIVINISSENDTNINGVINLTDTSIENTISYIKGAEFFIGLSSGLSWLSWSLDKKCFTITGFIDDFFDFDKGNTKIQNKSVCNSCWSKHLFSKEWEWCPENNDYICSKSITSQMVIEQLKL